MILAITAEICVRAVFQYMCALMVVNIELLVLGIGLCITTIVYVRLQKCVFENEFAEE